MFTKPQYIIINLLQALYRVCLMVIIVISLQGSVINDFFDYFNIDAVELSESFAEEEKETEGEESDIDEFLQEIFGFNHRELSYINPFKNSTSKITAFEFAILTPPPELA